ncbi:MAG: indolepyruvate ferredoxin oxidoreductase subunit alpha, partial [Armatimonadota bacterium]|nr:indolepyruvate ferredoxin oxidoreductase subunit alpha [Armatimonadota bacterium]
MVGAPPRTTPPGTTVRRALLLGNHALARGAWEAGVQVAAGYPGTPSTEILEALAVYDDVYVEWSTNEKVALDVAVGAALGGARALVTTKHVGLNVAADTLMVLGYTGTPAGCVIVSADDPGMHSSQNEQDNRHYARFAGLPLLEPADPAEARTFTLAAFDLSEAFEVPVLLRTTTRISHGCGLVEVGERRARPPLGFHRDPGRWVMLPAHARSRHPVLLERLRRLAEASEASPLTAVEMRDRRVGVVVAGGAYHYVREVLPEASVLKLGFSYPLPLQRIRAFATAVDRLIVVEELDPLVEEELRAAGLTVEGKAFFPRTGELTPEVVREGFIRAGVLQSRPGPAPLQAPDAPRPPVLCPGCPHAMPFLALRRLGAVVAGDIGCYTLAALQPLAAMDTCLAMGASIGVAMGLARSGGVDGRVVAAIGDSTFLHAGLPALLDAVYNQTPITVLILDNGTTAMTGGQPHPATGQTIRGAPAPRVDLAALCRALGVDWVEVVDPYDVGATYRALEAALSYPGVSVVITNRPCVESPVKIRTRPLAVVPDACTACQACMALGCPAIAWIPQWYEGRPKVGIDASLCMGCTVCSQLCPAGA